MSPARRSTLLAVAVLVLAAVGLVGIATAQSQVTLTITVVDGDGAAAQGVDVTASWDGGQDTQRSRANGQVLIDVPRGENVSITVDHRSYVRNRPYEIVNATGGDVEVPVVRSGTATIDVVDDGDPVGQAIVRLRQDGKLVVNERTGDDGRFVSDAIERDTYSLTVLKSGYARNRSDLVVDGFVDRTVAISEASTDLRVTVTDDHFDPPRAVREATVSVGEIGTVRTLSGGEASISVPVNDRYDVAVTKAGYEETETSIKVDEATEGLNVTIQRAPAVNTTALNDRVVVDESVRVTVVDEYGDPIEGATVTRDGTEIGTTDADGGISVPIPSAGEHEIGVSADGLTDTVTVEGVQPGEQGDTDTQTITVTPTAEDGPGFGAVAALVALLGAGLWLGRR
jgi:PGF-CTERM protein